MQTVGLHQQHQQQLRLPPAHLPPPPPILACHVVVAIEAAAAMAAAAAVVAAAAVAEAVALVDAAAAVAGSAAAPAATFVVGYFFCVCTDLTPLHTSVTVSLADPSVGSVVANSTTSLPCPTAPSRILTGYYTPSFSRNLVGFSHLHDLGVVTTFSLDELVVSCTLGTTGAPLDGTPSSGFGSPRVASFAPPLACTAVHSLRRGSVARCPSLLLVPPHHGSLTGPALGRLGPVPGPWSTACVGSTYAHIVVPALPSCTAAPVMASLNVLTFDAEGRAVDFEVWLDDLQILLQCDSKDGLSLFDLTSGASTTPAADAHNTVQSQWLTRDAAARLAVRNHLLSTERAHFSQYKSARALYDAKVAGYSSPTTAALGRLMLPYLFPDLAAFATVADLLAHLRTSDARYRAALPTEFLPTNSPPMDQFLSLCPTKLTVDLLEERLAAVEKSILAVAASRGDRCTPFFEGCSPVPLLPSVASAATVDLVGTEEVGAASALVGDAALARAREAGVVEGAVKEAVEEVEEVEVVVGVVPGVGASVAAVEVVEAVAEELEAAAAVVEVAEAVVLVTVQPRSVEALVAASFPDAVELPPWHDLLLQNVPIFDLEFDAILAAMYALADITEGDCYLRVPPDPGTVAAALGASAAAALGASASAATGAGTYPLSGTAPTESFHTFTLDSGLPRSLPPLPPGPAPTCVPCVEGRQLATPHSSFPPTDAPLQTLHMDVWGPARVGGQGHERYFLLVIDDYSRYTTVFPLRSKGEVPEVLIDWIRSARRQLSESFGSDLPVLCLHSDRGGEFSSDLLRAFCRSEGIRQTFTLPASPQQNGIAERRIGMVMDVSRTSMIHAAAPHFLWPFAVQYAAHQINLQPRVSLPETTPTLRWTGKVGYASAFRVWGSRAFVRDPTADKLSSRAVPSVFLGFPPDAPGWQFYHPTSRCVLSSQDVTFDELVSYYHLFPYRTASSPPPPLFLAPGTPLVDPAEPVEVAVDSGAARGAYLAGAGPWGAETGGAETWGAESGDAESGGALGAAGAGAARGATGATGGAGAAGGGAGAGATGGAACAGGAGGAAGAAEGAAGGGATGGAGAAGGGAGAGASGGAAGAGAARAPGGAGGGAGAGAAGGAAGTGDPGAEDTGSVSTVSRGAARPRPYYVPLLQHVLGSPPSPGPPPPFLSPPPVQSQSQLRPASPLPGPSPYSCPTRGLTKRREPETRLVSPASRAVSPVRPVRTSHVSRPRLPPVPGTHSMTLRPSTASQRVPLHSPPASSLPDGLDVQSDSLRAASPTIMRFLATAVTDPLFQSSAASALVAELVDFAAACRLDYATSLVGESAFVCPPSVGVECALGTDVLEDRQEDLECFAAASPHLVSMLLAPEGDPDALDIPTPRSYAEAIEGPYSSQWQAAMDAEMASWKSTGTYVDEVLPPGANIWHDTLRTTLAALGFAPSTADASLFLRTDATLPPFYVLVYVDDLVFATADTEALAHVKFELQKRHTCTDLAPPSDESVEPSGPYPELVGCLITSGMGLVLGGRARVVLTGHADASWVDDLATQRSSQGYTFSLGSGSVSWRSTRSSSILSSSCEAEIYAGAMAAQELRWLTYLLTDLGEAPRSPPVLYVDNKAILALCEEHRLEHRTKHIGLRYFLARELQQRGQLRLAYVASQANTADVFTKALQPCDHQRFCTVLGLVPTVPHLLTS
ncbi:unnamed protein product [Closterium sp. NIES-54]